MRAEDWLKELDTGIFAGDYSTARTRFLHAAVETGAVIRSYVHPLTGPAGEPLATDVAWLGPSDASKVLVLQSAMHGVEGFCGSAAQSDFLVFSPVLLPDTAVLLIHAINPYGFAWLRRVTEDGVDLNRNFVDFSQALPDNSGYDELAEFLVPANLDPRTLTAVDVALAAYKARHGRQRFEQALSGGQYAHPKGLFYGGTAPTWSRLTTESIIADFDLAERKRIVVIDFHTGLGPFGYGEPICDHPPGSIGAKLARDWFGDSLTEPALGTSSSVSKFGLSDYGWQLLVGEGLVFVALEFGTFDFASMIRVLRADHWLHSVDLVDWYERRVQDIKSAIRHHFSPESSDWRQMVLFRSRQVIVQALAGMVS